MARTRGLCCSQRRGPLRELRTAVRALVLSAVFAVALCGCDSTWESYNGYCYKYFSSGRNFDTAQSLCEGEGANLTSIWSEGERDFVRNLAGQVVWIGLTDEGTQGVFRWTDGSDIVYVSWRSGQPSTSGDCVRMRTDSTWEVVGCSNPIRYVCKKPFNVECGDGFKSPSEPCDGGACCFANCTLRAGGTVCRAQDSSNTCDQEEQCDGVNGDCPTDAKRATGAACGSPSHGTCDAFHTCQCTTGYYTPVTAAVRCATLDTTVPLCSSCAVTLQSSTTTSASISWSGFSDGQTGLRGYEYAVGTADNQTAASSWQFVGTGISSASIADLDLYVGRLYYVYLRAVDLANNTLTRQTEAFFRDRGTMGVASGATPGTDISFQVPLFSSPSTFSGQVSVEIDFDHALGLAGQNFTFIAVTPSALSSVVDDGGLAFLDNPYTPPAGLTATRVAFTINPCKTSACSQILSSSVSVSSGTIALHMNITELALSAADADRLRLYFYDRGTAQWVELGSDDYVCAGKNFSVNATTNSFDANVCKTGEYTLWLAAAATAPPPSSGGGGGGLDMVVIGAAIAGVLVVALAIFYCRRRFTKSLESDRQHRLARRLSLIRRNLRKPAGGDLVFQSHLHGASNQLPYGGNAHSHALHAFTSLAYDVRGAPALGPPEGEEMVPLSPRSSARARGMSFDDAMDSPVDPSDGTGETASHAPSVSGDAHDTPGRGRRRSLLSHNGMPFPGKVPNRFVPTSRAGNRVSMDEFGIQKAHVEGSDSDEERDEQMQWQRAQDTARTLAARRIQSARAGLSYSPQMASGAFASASMPHGMAAHAPHHAGYSSYGGAGMGAPVPVRSRMRAVSAGHGLVYTPAQGEVGMHASPAAMGVHGPAYPSASSRMRRAMSAAAGLSHPGGAGGLASLPHEQISEAQGGRHGASPSPGLAQKRSLPAMAFLQNQHALENMRGALDEVAAALTSPPMSPATPRGRPFSESVAVTSPRGGGSQGGYSDTEDESVHDAEAVPGTPRERRVSV